MKVKLELQDHLKEPYAVIYTGEITKEITHAINFLKTVRQEERVLILEKEEKYIMVKREEVYMARFEDNRVVLYGKGEKYLSKKRLYEVEEELGKEFIRISKTTIVNSKYMVSVEPSFSGSMLLKLKNGLNDYISRKYLPDFKRRIGL